MVEGATEVQRDAAAQPAKSVMRDFAHELRDALSPVASSLDLLRLQNFDPQATRGTVERIDRGLRRALRLIDSFVMADEVERGHVTLELRCAGLDDLLAAVHDALTPELDRRCTFVPCGAALQVLADRAQTTRVIGALVQHAEALALPDTPLTLQASAAGPPEISVQFLPDQRLVPSGGWFGSWRSRTPGALPLRTARRLLQLQHGELTVRVSETQGEFVAQLRADGARAEPPSDGGADRERTARAAHPAAPTRVMIVDDSSEVRKAYREALVALGYTVSEAVNAEEALGAIQNDLPQVALIDIHLPQMNGYRLAQTIKARVGSEVRLIMLSGMTMDEVTRRLSRQAGFDDCLDKMAGPAALHRLLQSGGSP